MKLNRSIIPACDVDWPTYVRLIRALEGVPGIEAVKIGVALALCKEGLHSAVQIAHNAGLKVIYDHQKAGTDIHEATPGIFMDQLVLAQVDAVILFPQSGPAVQYEWTKAAQYRNLGVIIGGEMTHPRYLSDDTDDGKKEDQNYTEIFAEYGLGNIPGYIRTGAPRDIFKLACKMGVTDFVVPGNKPDRIRYFHGLATGLDVAPTFYSPGLVAQGGDLKEGAKVVQECAEKVQKVAEFHGIVGRALYQAENIHEAAVELTSQL